MNDWQEIQQLALQAQQYAAGSQERMQCMSNLATLMIQSGELVRITRPTFIEDPGMEILHEAIQETFLNFDEIIDHYDPTYMGRNGKPVSFLSYFKTTLKWNYFRLARRYTTRQARNQEINDQNLKAIERIKQRTHSNEYEELRKLIRDDPEGVFKNAHIRNHPEATFQAIALARMNGCRWRELSEQWGIPLSALQRFFERKRDEFKTIFIDYLGD